MLHFRDFVDTVFSFLYNKIKERSTKINKEVSKIKQKTVQMLWLKIIALNLFLSMFIGSVCAEPVIASEPPDTEKLLSGQGASENTVSPLDIEYNTEVWATFSSATTVYYAPYASGNAPTEHTRPAGSGAFV